MLRASNPKVAYLSFIYRYYKPWCYIFEVVDSCRRLLLGGLFVFYSEANDALNCWSPALSNPDPDPDPNPDHYPSPSPKP